MILFQILLTTQLTFAASTKTVLFLGDSITAGYGVKDTEAFPALICDKAKANKLDAKCINGGESGALSAQMLPRLEWFIKKASIDILVLVVGGNDARQMVDPKIIEKQITETIQLARTKKIPVILGGMKIFTNYDAGYSRKFEKLYLNLSKQPGVTLIPFILEGVGGHVDMNQADGFHPNPNGHSKIADLLWPILRKKL